ncbi:unnamed protein product [Boreogadus saida]
MGASARNTPRLPCLPPPPALPAARCLKMGSSPGTFSFHRRWPEAIDIFKAGVLEIDEEDLIEVDDAASSDNIFADSTSRLSHSRASTATAIPREKPCRMAELFGEIMGALMSDDRQGEYFRTQSSSRRATQCPLPCSHSFSISSPLRVETLLH